MREVRVTFEDKEFEKLELLKNKLKLNWRDYILKLAKIEA